MNPRFFILFVWTCLLGTSAALAMPEDPVDRSAAIKAQRERRIAPLRAAGVNVDSPAEVIGALETGETGVRVAAAYLLKENKIAAAIPGLEKIAEGASNATILRLAACDALSELAAGAVKWKSSCRSMLAATYDPATRIRAAGSLAKAGDASGWEIVRNALLSPQAEDVEEASFVAPDFDGLHEANGSPIRVLKTCEEVFPKAEAAAQVQLASVIFKVAKPGDAAVLTTLSESSKSQYLRDYFRALARSKSGK